MTADESEGGSVHCSLFINLIHSHLFICSIHSPSTGTNPTGTTNTATMVAAAHPTIHDAVKGLDFATGEWTQQLLLILFVLHLSDSFSLGCGIVVIAQPTDACTKGMPATNLELQEAFLNAVASFGATECMAQMLVVLEKLQCSLTLSMS